MLKLLLPSPAALIKTEKTKTLVIADLHLGWELALKEKGIHLPSQTSNLLEKLKGLLVKYKPKTLTIIGDVKHTIVARESAEWREIPEFFNEIKKYVPEINIVRGNHDGNLELMLSENVKIHPASGVVVGDVGLFHGHKWASPTLLGCKTLLMGHLHPTVVFHDLVGSKLNKQVWVKAETFSEALAEIFLKKHRIKLEGTLSETLYRHYKVKLKVEQIFVMPSFNHLLGGRPINASNPAGKGGEEMLIGPVLRSDGVALKNAELYLLDGTYLGTVDQLRNSFF
ncbi:MAG: metallophosphoesterase [Candidatus Bathyarchaeota archaeon]|nr:metallophosphoesterase [Candidatus Bathyarchaeota archaeon]